jgi:hypothetical protein
VSNVIEIILQGRNNAGAAFAQAGAQTALLRGELATLNPALAGSLGRFGGLADAVGGLGGGLAGVVGVGAIAGAAIVGIGAAAFGAAKGMSEAVERLDLLSARTGVSVENLQVMQRIVKENGGSVDNLSTSLTFLNRAIGNNDPMLKSLGITTRDTFEAFQQLSRILASSSDTAANTAVGMHLLGRGSAELLGQVESLTAGFGPMQKRMIEAGLLLRGDLLDSARATDAQMDALSRNLEGMATRLKAMVVPAVLDAVRAFNDLADAINGVQKGPEEINSRAIEKAKQDIAELAAGLDRGMYQGEGIERARANLERLGQELERLRAKQTQLRAESGASPYGPANVGADTADAMRRAAAASGDTATTDRVKAIKAMTEALVATGLGWKEASAHAASYYEQLKRLEQMKAVDKMVAGAAELALRMKSVAEYVREAADASGTVPEGMKPRGSTPTSADLVSGLKPVERKEPQLSDFGQYLNEVASAQQAMNDILSVAQMTREGLASVFEGLQSGFQTAFAGIVQGTMNLRAALISIFQSLVDAIISELARLAAASVFRFLLSLVNPLGSGLSGGSLMFGSSGTPIPTAMAPVTNVITNNTIQAISLRDVLGESTSPLGVLRRANTRMAQAGAY